MRNNILTVFLAAILSALAVGAFLRLEQVGDRATRAEGCAERAETALNEIIDARAAETAHREAVKPVEIEPVAAVEEPVAEAKLPPVEPLEAVVEMTNSASAAYAGHASVACTSGGTALPVLPVADGLGAAHGNARQFFITPTSTDIVRLVSKNGVAASQGTAICTDASLGCSTKMPVPTSTDLWTCQADSTTATISLLGIRY